MDRPLLIVFLGFPGSGKTYFATRLAERIKAVTLNSDAIRISMFGSLEKIEKIRKSDNKRLYNDVFGAMNYATRQILLAGHSVIYDAQQSKRQDRRRIEKLAQESGAIPILIWMKTSKEVAKLRGQERHQAENSHPYTAEKMEYLVERFESVTDLPEQDENVIAIDGEATFDEQYDSFRKEVDLMLKGASE